MSKRNPITSIFAGVCCLTAVSQPALSMGAMIGPLQASQVAAIRANTAMEEGRLTMSPIGHILMCKRHPAECEPKVQRVAHLSGSVSDVAFGAVDRDRDVKFSPVELTQSAWQQLVRVNTRVNAQIQPVPDYPATGKKDVWSVYGSKGDCEDYAIRKRQELIRLGWPSHATLITIGIHPIYGMHAVLTVRTTKGDFVLDNLQGTVKPWRKTPYRWVKRQSKGDPRKWVKIGVGSPQSASLNLVDRANKHNASRRNARPYTALPPVASQNLAEKKVKRSRVETHVARPETRVLRVAKVGVSGHRHATDRGIAGVWSDKSTKQRRASHSASRQRRAPAQRKHVPANLPWYMR